jgi:hypothetical protein
MKITPRMVALFIGVAAAALLILLPWRTSSTGDTDSGQFIDYKLAILKMVEGPHFVSNYELHLDKSAIKYLHTHGFVEDLKSATIIDGGDYIFFGPAHVYKPNQSFRLIFELNGFAAYGFGTFYRKGGSLHAHLENIRIELCPGK